MTGMRAYWESLKGLRPDQRMFLPAIEWLVDNTDDRRIRRSGRTTVLATALIRAACVAPRRPVRIFDHMAGSEQARHMANVVDDLIKQAGASRWFRVRVNPPSVEAVEGWSLEGDEGRAVRDGTLARRTDSSRVRNTDGCGPESVLEDVRSAALAALAVGASPDQVLEAVRDAVVMEVMNG